MSNVGFINGRFMPLEAAMVSVEDRGFQFGDGVYEVIRTYHGIPFLADEHLIRLDRSAGAIALTNPFSLRQWREFIEEGIRLGGYEESKVYIQLTRGTAPRDHSFPQQTAPTAVMTICAMRPLDQSTRSSGVEVITLNDFRWGRCDIKSLNLLSNVLARQRAKEAGAFEAIFVREGWITEGAVSNVMVVRDDILVTPQQGEWILSGVTRTAVLDLARKEGIAVREQNISAGEFRAAEEIFLTGTTVEILAVVSVDRMRIGSGKPGALTERLSARFSALVG
ncbi:MAG: D-amino-acid transaminase [Nitrospiraceae bacterium]